MPAICLAALGVTAATLNMIGLGPYVRDIFRKDNPTQPERAMWWIHALLSTVLFIAQLQSGAGWLLLVTGAYVVSTSVIAVLSLRYGYGTFHKRDTVSIALALLGIVLWWTSNNPLMAIIMVVIVDFVGFWLTLFKTWHAPHSETLVSWQLSIAAAGLSVFSVGSWNLELLIYPVYAVVGAVSIVWVITYRRAKVAEDLVDV